MKRICLLISLTFLLSGCWSNQELDETALVHGIGLDKAKEDKIHISFEVIKPGGGSQEGGDSEAESGNSAGSGEHIVIDEISSTLLESAREAIKFTKRRLDFGHTEAWILSENLARENFIRTLDVIRRDQMLRLNSHIFITKDKPSDVLNTPTLYEHLVASELASSLEQTRFIAEYAPITLRELYKYLEGPVSNAYIPIIYIEKRQKQTITAIDGTAIIKKDRMVGKLNKLETAGMNLLLNNIKGGSIQTTLDDERVSIEILKLKTKTVPTLKDHQLDVNIHVEMEGTLADNMTSSKVDGDFLNEVGHVISEHTKEAIQAALDKLQDDLKTDMTEIGVKTYHKYPKEWKRIRDQWDEIFSNATTTIQVDTNVIHQGLINESIHHHDKPFNNPYLRFKH